MHHRKKINFHLCEHFIIQLLFVFRHCLTYSYGNKKGKITDLFFIISTRKCIIYALLYISTTLNVNAYFQTMVYDVRRKSVFAAVITLLILTKSFLHHKDLRVLTSTFSYLLIEGYNHIYLRQKLYFTPVYLE